MSGVLCLLIPGFAPAPSVVDGAAWDVIKTTPSPTPATASIVFNSDGSVALDNGTGPNWYSVVTAGIGSSYWVKFTLASGSAWDAGLTAGTVYALSTNRTLGWTQAGLGIKSATATVNIYSDAGGTVRVGGGTITATVEVA